MEQVLTEGLTDVKSFIDLIRPYCIGNKAQFEISWTLNPGKLEKYGRINYWIDACTWNEIAKAKDILDDLNAPAEVKNAFYQFKNILRIGLGFARTGGGHTLRLYLHGQKGPESVNCYEAWRWDTRGTVKKHIYAFQFHSTVTGDAMKLSVPLLFANAFNQMTGDERFRQISGYWVRNDEDGKTDNIYLALPWLPVTEQLPGMHQILNDLRIPEGEWNEIMIFPVKDFGYKIKQGVPEITIYTSGNITDTIPDNEEELHRLILTSAADTNRQMASLCELLQIPAAIGENGAVSSTGQIAW